MNTDFEDEDYSLSLSKFESMLKTNKVFFFDSEEFEDIILHYLDNGKINLAKKALRLGLEQHPKSTGLRLVQVEMLVYEDKLDPAERILNELEIIEPTNEEIYIQRANICSKKDQHENAVKNLNIALQYSEDPAEIYAMLGMEFLFADDLEAAKENFIKCLELDEEDYSALYNVVYCFDFLDQHEEAIHYLESFIDKKPYTEVAWHQLGRQYYALKNYEKALWAFDYASLIDETFIGAILEKAKSLEKLHRYEEAIENYKLTLELDDPTAYAYLRIGKCYNKLDKNDEALAFLSKTVEEDPSLDKAWYALTEFYIKQKDFQKALFYINKALAIETDNNQYWRSYALINQYLGYFEEAEIGFRKAFDLDCFELDNFICWADTLYILGEYDASAEVLSIAKSYYNEDVEILFRLVGIYAILEENFLMVDHLNTALLIDYDAKKILKKLFPDIYNLDIVQRIIKNFIKP